MNSRSTSVENCALSVSVVRHVTDYRSFLIIKPTRLVTRVFPRFWRFSCFYFEFSLALCDIFLYSDWFCDYFGFVLTTLDRKALQCRFALFQVLINMSLFFFF